MEWYALNTFSSQELTVKKRIEQMAERENLTEKIGKVLVPTQEYIKVKDGKRKKVSTNLFPGYVMIEMDLDRHTQYMVTSVPGVTRFVGDGGTPIPLRKSEVDRLLGIAENPDEIPEVEIPYVEGDQVRIKEGPFNDFVGAVEEVNTEKRKLKVMVSVFGRSTPVELSFNQVEAVTEF